MMKTIQFYIIRSVLVVLTILSIVSCNKKKAFDGYLYPIQENGLYGYIDSVGNKIIEPEFLWVSTFRDGLALAVVDTIYRTVPDSMAFEVGVRNTIEKTYRMYIKYGYVNKLGDFAIEPRFICYVIMPEIGYVADGLDNCSNVLNEHSFHNKRAMYYDTITWKNGYIDTKGNVAIEPKYFYSEPFSEGLAVVRDAVAKPVFTNGVCVTPSRLRCAYIDTLGNRVTECKYETLTRYCSGRGIGTFKKVDKEEIAMDDDTTVVFESYSQPRFLISGNGTVIKELDYNYDYYGFSRDGISVVSDGFIWRSLVGKEGKSYGFINKDGEFLEPLKGLSDYQLDSLSKCDDIMGVLPEDASIVEATYFADGLAGISPDSTHWVAIDKYLIIHGYGEESIFEDFKGFNNGLAAVKRNGKWGYINKKIKEQIPCKYDSCGLVYPYLEEIFEYDIQGKVNKRAYINRKDSLVWESNILTPKEIKNDYSNKEKEDLGKWKYKYCPFHNYLHWGLIIGLGALFIAIIIGGIISIRTSRKQIVKPAIVKSTQAPFTVDDSSNTIQTYSNVVEDEDICLYPSVAKYTETIRLASNSPEDYFDKLSGLHPVLDNNGDPVMSSGNFAVVFKMVDRNGKYHAARCFHREQKGRGKNYKLICEALAKVSSPYLLSVKYLEKELFVDSEEYPVLLMDWAEGMTLDKYLRQIIDDEHALWNLISNFRQLSIWLLSQPFAHGDLKPDNIIVKNDGSLVLVDYDGMFVPAMHGQIARELGSQDFRNPLRTESGFDKDIDNFPIISILLSLELLIANKDYLSQFGAEDRLLFSEQDYRDTENSQMFQIASKSTRDNVIDLVGLLREELSGEKHSPEKLISIISGADREKEYHANDKINLFANILLGLYSISYMAFPIIAFSLLEWGVLYIILIMTGANVAAYLLFNIIDAFRPNKKNHILEGSPLGCLGILAVLEPILFMASSSYEEEWYITALIWVLSWLSLMIYMGMISLKDMGLGQLFQEFINKEKEDIGGRGILEELSMSLFFAPLFGLPILVGMIMANGRESFYVWLRYILIIDTVWLIVTIISLIYRSIGKKKN